MSLAGVELNVIDEWIYSVLSGNSELNAMLGAPNEIHVDTIPGAEIYPYIFAQMMSTSDTVTTEGTTVIVIADYQIKGVDRATSYSALMPIAAKIYSLLHKKSGVVADGQVLKCIRQRQVHYPQVTETVSYRHLGGIYRFWVES